MIVAAISLAAFIMIPVGLVFAIACLGMIGSDIPRGPLPPWEDEDNHKEGT